MPHANEVPDAGAGLLRFEFMLLVSFNTVFVSVYYNFMYLHADISNMIAAIIKVMPSIFLQIDVSEKVVVYAVRPYEYLSIVGTLNPCMTTLNSYQRFYVFLRSNVRVLARRL